MYNNKLEKRGSLNLDINSKHWDFENKHIINLDKGGVTFDERENLKGVRDILKNIERVYKDELRELKYSLQLKSYTNNDWKVWCNNVIAKATGRTEQKERYLITEVINTTKEDKETLGEIKGNTIKEYDITKSKIELFQEYKGKIYYSEEIDSSFLTEFKIWFNQQENPQNKEVGYAPSYIGNCIAKIKASINHFRVKVPNFQYSEQVNTKTFKRDRSQTKHEVLRTESIEKLYSYNGSELMNKVRDLAIIQYHSCMRFNEVESELNGGYDKLKIFLNKNSKGEEYYLWDVYQGKEKDKKVIPVHSKIKELYLSGRMKELYNIKGNRKGLVMVGASMRKYIKEICQELNINIESIGTHSFRRSFITNMINNGYSHHEIMEYSGHKTISAFQSYCQQHNIKLRGGNSISLE